MMHSAFGQGDDWKDHLSRSDSDKREAGVMNLNIAMLKTLSPMRSSKITKQSVAKALKRVVQFAVMGEEDITNEKPSRFSERAWSGARKQRTD